MVLRLLSIGLCGACVVLLATYPARVPMARPALAPPAAVRDGAPALRVVDVGAGVASPSIPKLVGLSRGEWIKAVNDQVPSDDVEAELMIGSLARRGGFLDLTVASGGAAERRVLMLIH